MCMSSEHLGLIFLVATASLCATTVPAVEYIVQRSVDASNADWAVAPQYNFVEKDVITKYVKRTSKSYQVLMIEGSPYNKLLAIDDEPLSPQQAANEQRKLNEEIERRRHETTDLRRNRIAKYQRERSQDHSLMQRNGKGLQLSAYWRGYRARSPLFCT